MILRLLTFIIIGLSSLSLALAESVEIKLNSGQLRLRENFDSNSNACGTASIGQKFESIQMVNGWYQVRTNDSTCPTAWIHSYFTKKFYNGPKSAAFLSNWNPGTVTTQTSGDALNLRKTPNGRSCGRIVNGTQTEKLAEKDGWYLIKTNNRNCPTAWIHGYYTQGQYDGPQTSSYLRSWNPREVASATTSPSSSESETRAAEESSRIIPSNLQPIAPTIDEAEIKPPTSVAQTSEVGQSKLTTTMSSRGARLEAVQAARASRSLLTPESSFRPQIRSTANSESISSSSDESLIEIANLSNNTNRELITLAAARQSAEIANSAPTRAAPRYFSAEAADDQLCAFVDTTGGADQTKTENCEKLLKLADEGKISKDALRYTLQYFKMNQGELQDRTCADSDSQPNAPKGISNSCQFVINDMNERISGFSNRSPSHFIDLCDGGEGGLGKGLINSSYVNRGTGSSRDSDPEQYIDRNGDKTTVIGPFLTGALRPFTPFKISRQYRNIGWKRCTNIADCKVLRLELYGLMESNNDSTHGPGKKPLHVSPYRSSSGCPSVSVDNRWQILALNKNGPSLVMNYGPQKYHDRSSLTNCKNE